MYSDLPRITKIQPPLPYTGKTLNPSRFQKRKNSFVYLLSKTKTLLMYIIILQLFSTPLENSVQVLYIGKTNRI